MNGSFQVLYSSKLNGFVLAEPIGSVSPKITNADDLKHVKVKNLHSLSLLCPAQAYPQPAYR